MNETQETLGMELKIARIRKRLTQYQLGELVQQPSYNICRYETGRGIPSSKVLAKIKRALGLAASVK